MVKHFSIRLRRAGRLNRPVYDVVVAYKNSSSTSGKFFEKIGFYHPASAINKLFFIDLARFSSWLLKGAFVSTKLNILLGNFYAAYLPSVKNKRNRGLYANKLKCRVLS